jgi:hypothetical protein
MAIDRYPDFHESAEGGLAENKNWWAIIVDTSSGRVWVEHRWHYVNPYSGVTSSKGEELHPVAEFVRTTEGRRLRKELEAALRDAGVAA